MQIIEAKYIPMAFGLSSYERDFLGSSVLLGFMDMETSLQGTVFAGIFLQERFWHSDGSCLISCPLILGHWVMLQSQEHPRDLSTFSMAVLNQKVPPWENRTCWLLNVEQWVPSP